MLKNFEFHDTDTRTRRYIVPKRILRTWGETENTDCLLRYHNRQIKLQEKELATLRTTPTQRAGILFDFGTEFHGAASLSVRKVEGDGIVRLCFGESAAEALSHIGEKGACNDHSARDFEVQIKNYSVNEYAYTGYRFLYVELVSEGFITVSAVQGVAIYQPYEYVGNFSCSDALLNRIYDTAVYTCHLCIQNELWDGIKRDRLIWIGDVAPEMKTIKYVFGEIPELYRALAIEAEAAALPLWINKHPTYSLWWLINLEEWSFYTGNTAYIDEQRDYVLGLTRQVLDNIDSDGFFIPDHFLDWPSKAFVEESRAGIRTVLLWSLQAAQRLCRYLGDNALATACESAAAKVGNATLTAGNLKQVAAMLVLGELQDKSCEELLRQNGAQGFSTFMSYYLLSAMARCAGTEDTLAALKEYYGAMLSLGATTFWEDFDLKWAENACPIDEIPDGTRSDVHGDNGNYCYLGFRHSLCHGWASGPVAFLTEHVLGVHVTGAGCSEIELKPNLGSLSFAKGCIATPHGKVEICHEKQSDGRIQTTYTAPAEVRIILK